MAIRETRSRTRQEQDADDNEHEHEIEHESIPQPILLSSKRTDVKFKTVPAQDLESKEFDKNNQNDLSNGRDSSPSLPQLPPHYDVEGSQHSNGDSHLTNGTQKLSQSIYQSIILRSKSTSIPEDVLQREYEGTTQHTLNEGDEGHVDITSSFVTNHAPLEQNEDLEVDDISPAPSPTRLTQFPESQRFKTPATAGKKRNYNGDTVESPAGPRNPLARDAAAKPTPSKIMGLSQAFAGTQAASSPFSNGLPTVLRSDRPSPNIGIQSRLAHTSSSPLRMLTDTKRATAEPAAYYVPMLQSQNDRDHQMELDQEPDRNVNISDDFEHDSSATRRERRRKERDQRFHDQLRAMTSPMSPGSSSPARLKRGTMSSPIRPTLSLHLDKPHPEAFSEPTILSDINAMSNEQESEADTEPEDDMMVAVRRSSQPPQGSEEDKENQVRSVPDTVYRLQHAIHSNVSYVEASPCVRTRQRFGVVSDPQSSDQFRIANSQPSQQLRTGRSSATTGNIDTTRSTGVIGPRVQSRLHKTAQYARPDYAARDAGFNSSGLDGPSVESPASALIIHTRNATEEEEQSTTRLSVSHHTVPETNLNLKRGQEDAEINGNISMDTSTTKFNTAPSHQLYGRSKAEMSEGSSQPIVKTPPGRRRMRLLDISANNSPFESPSGFDVTDVLQLDPDDDVATFLQSTPENRVTYSSKRRRIQRSSITPKAAAQSTRPVKSPSPRPRVVTDPSMQFEGNEEPIASLEPSQAIVQPTRPRLSGRAGFPNTTQSSPPPQRQSMWEPTPSPIAPKEARSRDQKAGTRKFEKHKPGKAVQTLRPGGNLEQMEDDSSMSNLSSDPYVASMDVSGSLPPSAAALSDDIVAPNMVFACYTDKVRAYYPALCLGLAGSDTLKYIIQWEGYDPDEIDAQGVKSLDLRIGDTVKISLDGYPKVPYIIRGFKDKVSAGSHAMTDIRGFQTLVVAQKHRKNLPPRITAEPQEDVPVAAIYLDNILWQQMKKREFNYQCPPLDEHSGYATPMERAVSPDPPNSRHQRHALLAGIYIPSYKPKGIFSNMAFAVSYDYLTRKNAIVNLIQSNGGLVLEDSFLDLLEPDQIVLRPQFSELGFTALLTERHSRKEKYMQALALGLPCLSGRWVETCVQHGELVDWQMYLLAAGESFELDGATRSRVLPQMDPNAAVLRNTISMTLNLLAGASAVIVVGKGKGDVKRLPYVFLVQALGAEVVSKVSDLRAAKDLVDSASSYGWVFVDDKDLEVARGIFGPGSLVDTKSQRKKGSVKKAEYAGIKVADNEVIVQSLITGKLYEG